VWALANATDDLQGIVGGSGDTQVLYYYNGTLYLKAYENGSSVDNTQSYTISASTNYYVTITRDDDSGDNSKGQLVAVIRTTSHAGSVVATLTISAITEQNDFRYIFMPQSYNDSTGGADADATLSTLELKPCL
jgi:hypothetical protein